jgi:FkbM family methyltransferase
MENNALEIINRHHKIKGIVQVGANTGQECFLFRNYTNNIICFEPLKSQFNYLKKNNPEITCYNIALGDENETKEMYIASNNGESSSFLKPLNHLNEFTHIHFQKSNDSFEIKRFDSLNINLENYNTLVSDTQGYELNVFKGFGEKLNQIDSIYVEYINSSQYEGDSSLTEIENYLSQYGFKLLKLFKESENWGNAIFIK